MFDTRFVQVFDQYEECNACYDYRFKLLSKTVETYHDTNMIRVNCSPTVEIYHAFLRSAGFEGTLEVLDRMRVASLGPSGDTFLLILHRFFKQEQLENALKIWVEMKKYKIDPDCSHYTVLVEGLASCGLPIKARVFYAELRSNGFLDDPKLKKLFNEPVGGNEDKRNWQVRKVKRNKPASLHKGRAIQWKKVKSNRERGRLRNLIQNSD